MLCLNFKVSFFLLHSSIYRIWHLLEHLLKIVVTSPAVQDFLYSNQRADSLAFLWTQTEWASSMQDSFTFIHIDVLELCASVCLCMHAHVSQKYHAYIYDVTLMYITFLLFLWQEIHPQSEGSTPQRLVGKFSLLLVSHLVTLHLYDIQKPPCLQR